MNILNFLRWKFANVWSAVCLNEDSGQHRFIEGRCYKCGRLLIFSIVKVNDQVFTVEVCKPRDGEWRDVQQLQSLGETTGIGEGR